MTVLILPILALHINFSSCRNYGGGAKRYILYLPPPPPGSTPLQYKYIYYFCRYIWGSCPPPPPPNTKKLATLLAYGWQRMTGSRQCYDRPVSSKKDLNGSKLAWRCYGLGLPWNFLDAAPTLPTFSITLPWVHPWRSLETLPRLLYGDLTDTVIRLFCITVVSSVAIPSNSLRRGRCMLGMF